MAYENVVFPFNYNISSNIEVPMIHGMVKTIIDPVTIVSNGSYEARTKKQAWERYKWTIPTQTMMNAQKEEVKSFLIQRSHSLNSFKFVDPDAPVWAGTKLAHHSSTYWEVNLPYNTIQGGSPAEEPGTHPVFNHNAGQCNMTRNGSPAGADGSIIYIVDGVPCVKILGSSPSDEVIITSGPIYFTVRLNSTLSYALEALDTDNNTVGVNHSAIELIEVFGEHNGTVV